MPNSEALRSRTLAWQVAGISGLERGTGLEGGGDGGKRACGAAGRVKPRMWRGIGCNQGSLRFHRAARRAAEEPVAGLVTGTWGSERGIGLKGGGDGGSSACGAAGRSICDWDSASSARGAYRAARRAAEEPVAGAGGWTSGSERGTGLEGGCDGGKHACARPACYTANRVGHWLQSGLTVVSPRGPAGR
jgi:hypothetical protein